MPNFVRLAVYLIVVSTLALVIISVIGIMLYGLFDPKVDNDKIFALLAPNFSMIVGAFIGIVSSKMLDDKDKGP